MNKYQAQEVEPFEPAQVYGRIRDPSDFIKNILNCVPKMKEGLTGLEQHERKCYFIIETGKSCSLRKEIFAHLQKQRPNLKEVHSVDDCDVILVFCPIFSRAGTDIDAALNKLNACSASKPAIFMVFHLTFDPEKVVPDSSRCINRRNTLTVDCLFSEDGGLLTCDMNEKALDKIVQCFKYQGHLEIQEKKCTNGTNSLLYMLFKYLLRFCCWTFGTLSASIWNYITRRETHESSTNNKRDRLKETDEEKNV